MSDNAIPELFLALGIGRLLWALFKSRRPKVVDPDTKDPARYFWLLKVALVVVFAAAYFTLVAAAQPDAAGLVAILLAPIAAILVVCGIRIVSIRAAAYRISAGYAISDDSYKHAPTRIKASMAGIYKAAGSIEGGRAHRDGMFGDIEVTRLVYSAAKRAVLSSELAESTRDLRRIDDFAGSREQRHAKDRIEELVSEVRAVEQSLRRAKKVEGKLSRNLEEIDRTTAARRASEARRQKRAAAIGRIDEVTAQIDATTAPDATGVEDRITSVHAGYEDAEAITRQAGQIPSQEPEIEDSATAPESDGVARKTWSAAKSSAVGAGKLSKSAARFGASEIEKRRARKPKNA